MNMYKQFIKNMPHKLLLGIALVSPLATSVAEEADFKQEIVIVAKKQSSDLKNKIASYMEDVKITQGTLSIEADIVKVTNLEGTDLKHYLAIGKPARFSQILDDGQKIELQADEVAYSPTTQTIIIKGNASVSQEGSMVKGDIITYNIATEQLNAESASTVTTILKPEVKPEDKDVSPKINNEIEQDKEQ
ncbi:lipopolysaccharide transport periplasmic protein LptA [Thalassotalea fonticola]|uniref:Lipopolysaccharide transport periplasmic protein LptA n=1 Tax=Thalassotalea fonticola TaxID=3065649 RepID=A0ABZ0GKF6_9GAMM|nr:lipopolysaccharide transport periplasmic protein LptA [Colwelliaceae bacterium S1-1]